METLVIDDDILARNILLRQLTSLGHGEVHGCDGASAALKLISEDDRAVDLIFCDIQMPEMDGVEFIRHLVRINYRGRLVLVSGEDFRLIKAVEKLSHLHGLEVVGSLRKPVSMKDVAEILKKEIRPRKMISAQLSDCSPDELKIALETGQLFLQYQPKVRVDTGELAGVEGLVRWNHPDRGLVMPDYFIPTAENSGLIDDLTQYVLRVALDDAREWRAQGIAVPVAINVSIENLCSLNFPDAVQALLKRTQTPPSELMLEITESRLMKDISSSLDVLVRLRLKRIGLSIDDFGTGHSSLAQLRDVPFNELKIDRSFAHGAHQDVSLGTIFRASLEMAHKLEMKTVAEGIEDFEDWDFLRKIGCDVAQGWFIGRPMDAKKLAAWLEDWKSRFDDYFGRDL